MREQLKSIILNKEDFSYFTNENIDITKRFSKSDIHCLVNHAFEQHDFKKAKVLLLIADALSMRLNSDSFHKPFSAGFQIENQRSALPENFSEQDLEWFKKIIDIVENPKLKARLAEIILLNDRKSFQYALIAIDAYIQTTELNYLDRAINLCFRLKDKAKQKLELIENKLISIILDENLKYQPYKNQVANLLYKHKLGKNKQLEIAKRLEQDADILEKQKDLHIAQFYFQAAFEWYRRMQDTAKYNDMVLRMAENLILEAETALDAGVKNHWYRQALLKYREINSKYRPSNFNQVIEKIEKISYSLEKRRQRVFILFLLKLMLKKILNEHDNLFTINH